MLRNTSKASAVTYFLFWWRQLVNARWLSTDSSECGCKSVDTDTKPSVAHISDNVLSYDIIDSFSQHQSHPLPPHTLPSTSPKLLSPYVTRTPLILLPPLGLGIIDSNRFSRANQIKFASTVICLAVCKAGASSECLFVTKLALIALYHKFKQFNNILIHIFT